jgi:glycosyltransferase involved in cell wall biosynthesis
MRVLLIAPQPFLEWRGSPIRVGHTAAMLAGLGHEVDLLTLPLGRPVDVTGVRVLRVGNPLRIRRVPIGPSWRKLAFDLLLARAAFRFAAAAPYEVYHCVEESAGIGWALTRRHGGRLVHERHSDPVSHRGGALRNLALSLYARVEEFLLARADSVICTGRRTYAQAMALRADRPTHLVPDPPASALEASAADAGRLAARLRSAPGESLLAYVGSFAAYQGVDLVLGGFAHAVARGANARLVLAGGTPRDRARCEGWLADRGLRERVAWEEEVPPDELPALLASADVLLCPRRSGLNPPLKLIELLKAGRPILASDVPANRAVVDDECALLVANDEAAWGEAMTRLLSDRDLGAKLARAARHRFDTHYALPHFRARLARAYEELGPVSSVYSATVPAERQDSV